LRRHGLAKPTKRDREEQYGKPTSLGNQFDQFSRAPLRMARPVGDTRGRWPLGRQAIVPLRLSGLRLGTHTQHSHSQITNSALHVLRVVFYRVESGKGKQMIAAPIEPKASKVAQALAIAFIAFLVVLSVWELFAIRF
jgi:hypothetical protein